MRLAVKPDSLLEALVLRVNSAPEPILETQIALMSARAIMAATELGIFSCLQTQSRTLAEIAAACELEPRATGALLAALVSTRYLRYKRNQYHLTAKARKWVAPQKEWSLFHYMPHVRDVWRMAAGLEQFVKDGKALDIHESGLSAEEWSRYQRAMRSLAAGAAPEIARKLPIRSRARRMLDIGGSHGFYSVAACRKHPQLSATILELPEAIEHAAPILAMEGMGERVRHQAGDALTGELGEGIYDVILISNLIHHFTAAQSEDVIARSSRALAPGGALAILELIRPESPNSGDQIGQVLNLFFALTSTSGTWSLSELQGWLRTAGLELKRPIFLRAIPGAALVCGFKR